MSFFSIFIFVLFKIELYPLLHILFRNIIYWDRQERHVIIVDEEIKYGTLNHIQIIRR